MRACHCVRVQETNYAPHPCRRRCKTCDRNIGKFKTYRKHWETINQDKELECTCTHGVYILAYYRHSKFANTMMQAATIGAGLGAVAVSGGTALVAGVAFGGANAAVFAGLDKEERDVFENKKQAFLVKSRRAKVRTTVVRASSGRSGGSTSAVLRAASARAMGSDSDRDDWSRGLPRPIRPARALAAVAAAAPVGVTAHGTAYAAVKSGNRGVEVGQTSSVSITLSGRAHFVDATVVMIDGRPQFVYQSDMILGLVGAPMFTPGLRWPGGHVKLLINKASGLPDATINNIFAAVTEINHHCRVWIQIVDTPPDTHYVCIEQNDGNCTDAEGNKAYAISHLGYQPPGTAGSPGTPQKVSMCANFDEEIVHARRGINKKVRFTGHDGTVYISDTATPTGTIIHELLHTLGFLHMHDHPDRATFVTGCDSEPLQTGHPGDYDPYSILHYGERQGVEPTATMLRINPHARNDIGQRLALSHADVIAVNTAYHDSPFGLDEPLNRVNVRQREVS